MEHQYNNTSVPANASNPDHARGAPLDSIQAILTDASAYARRQVGTRVSTACERCRRRKIRCDGNMPSCRPCQKVNAACVFEQRGSPRPMVTGSVSSDLAEARSRIRHLENLLVKEQRRNARTGSAGASGAQSPLSPMYPPRDALTLPPLQGQYLQSPQQQPLPPFQPSHQAPPPIASMVDPQLQRTPAPPDEQQQQQQQQLQQQPALAHEIGLVSLTPGSEARYIGPSSGFFFARKIMSAVNNRHINGETARRNTEELRNQLSVALAKDNGVVMTPLPSTVDLCKRISAHYFRTIHFEFPFLHEGQHMALIDKVYEEPTPGPISAFQVNMVLAIAASDLSRRLKVDIHPDGYFSNAQKLLDKFSTEGSLKGLQSLLLLVIFAINQPNTGLNAWYLHYETIASVIDLGLQRDVSRTQIAFKEQEMRTRIFWVVYSLDRRLATMMGRPIGLRDEACELRYPVDTDDEELDRINSSAEAQRTRITHMTWAILLFKLAQINSEIKYVLHSISKESGHFSYAPVNDVMEWQQGMIRRLENWTAQVPAASEGEDGASLRQIWLQRGYEVYILLQWPSPAIRTPHESVMHKCYQSAQASLYMLVELYQSDQLTYNTMTIHSIFVSALTMLYCLGTMPNMANAVTQPTADIEKLYQSLNALSSLGEHWTEARKARDGLGLVARPIIRKALQQRGYQVDTESAKLLGVRASAPATPSQNAQPDASPNWPPSQGLDDLIPSMDAFMDPDFFIAQFEGFSALEDVPNESLVDPMLSGP